MKSGDPRIKMLRRFAKAMDIPFADLIDGKKEPEADETNERDGSDVV